MSKLEESNLDFWLFIAQFFVSVIIWIVFGFALSNFELGREELLTSSSFPAKNTYIWIPVLIGAMTYATVIISRGIIKFGYFILTVSNPDQTEG